MMNEEKRNTKCLIMISVTTVVLKRCLLKFYDVLYEKDDASVKQAVVNSNLTCTTKSAGL